jgi:hypothetical protein
MMMQLPWILYVFWTVYALVLVLSITCMIIGTVSLVRIANRLGELVKKYDDTKQRIE